MAAAVARPRLIESFYAIEELETASPGRRLGGYALDTLFLIVTLGIGWLIWFIIVASRGQTPGKQLLGMYVMREDGSRAGGWYTVLREVVVEGLLFGVVVSIFFPAWIVSAAWCMWDRDRQCLWDKVAATFVAHSPLGYRPLTAKEMRMQGVEPPGLMVAAPPTPPAPMPPAPPRPAAPAAPEGASTAERLRELQALHDDGVITDEEYEQRHARLVEEL
jgi:uncharacterized RDD family membrane protein YckC